MQLILAVILTINLSAPDYWVLHHDETIAASYYGPKDFKEKNKEISTAVDTVIYHTKYASEETDEGPMIFTLSYYRMDLDENMVEDVLNEIAHSGAQSLSGDLDYQRSGEIQGRPYVLCRISTSDGQAVVKSKVIYDYRYIIITQVTAPSGLSLDERVDGFIDSFRFDG